MKPSPVRSLFAGLTLLGVMCVQLFGVLRGYHCECTNAPSALASCGDAECHPPGQDHSEGETPCCDDQLTAENGQKPDSGDTGRHSEVREMFASTAAAAPVLVQTPVFVEIPPPFGVTDPLLITNVDKTPALPPERENGSPPVPLLTARTVVLMV